MQKLRQGQQLARTASNIANWLAESHEREPRNVEELLAWARAAGLALLQSQYLSQRNGFRIQLHVFQALDPSSQRGAALA